MRIGVLASQGAFAEHIVTLRRLGVEGLPVRLPRDLEGLGGLIIPGGESTSISKLMRDYHLVNDIKALARDGLPVLGTCAGMILLAREILDSDGVEPLGIMDIAVKRNAFGRQQESFETELSVPTLGEKPFPGVFIRAPVIAQTGNRVEVLARLPDDNDTVLAVKEGKRLALAFHPELTEDLRFHQYFLDMVAGRR